MFLNSKPKTGYANLSQRQLEADDIVRPIMELLCNEVTGNNEKRTGFYTFLENHNIHIASVHGYFNRENDNRGYAYLFPLARHADLLAILKERGWETSNDIRKIHYLSLQKLINVKEGLEPPKTDVVQKTEINSIDAIVLSLKMNFFSFDPSKYKQTQNQQKDIFLPQYPTPKPGSPNPD